MENLEVRKGPAQPGAPHTGTHPGKCEQGKSGHSSADRLTQLQGPNTASHKWGLGRETVFPPKEDMA